MRSALKPLSHGSHPPSLLPFIHSFLSSSVSLIHYSLPSFPFFLFSLCLSSSHSSSYYSSLSLPLSFTHFLPFSFSLPLAFFPSSLPMKKGTEGQEATDLSVCPRQVASDGFPLSLSPILSSLSLSFPFFLLPSIHMKKVQ